MSEHAVASIEELCRLLRRSRLLEPDEIDSLVQRWQEEAGEGNGVPEFSRWLVSGGTLTEYQMGRLLRGHADNFFLAGCKLVDQLARGKETAVYKALDPAGQVVALKVLMPSRGRDPRLLARFQREVRLGRVLNHAHVIRIHGAGEERGAHYLLMDYLEGETLHNLMTERGRLSPAEAIDLGLQALEGAGHLHEAGLIHGNLEPANLFLVRPTGKQESPLLKVLDFGATRTVSPYHPLAEAGDAEGPLSANPAYLAPELARDPKEGDIRADIYSLGCVLYHALARPERRVPRPLQERNPDVPEELALVIATMMAPDPNERFATTALAVKALRPVRDLEPTAPAVVEPLSWLDDHTPPPLPPPPPPEPPASPQEVQFVEVSEALVNVEPVAAPPEAVLFPGPLPQLREVPPPPRRAFDLDRRDFLMLLAGAAVLLLVQMFAWLLGRLASLLRRPPPAEPDNPEDDGEPGS
jgi:serine/threonine protein kinase